MEIRKRREEAGDEQEQEQEQELIQEEMASADAANFAEAQVLPAGACASSSCLRGTAVLVANFSVFFGRVVRSNFVLYSTTTTLGTCLGLQYLVSYLVSHATPAVSTATPRSDFVILEHRCTYMRGVIFLLCDKNYCCASSWTARSSYDVFFYHYQQIRALVNSELEACLVLHESKEFWQQRLDRPGANLLNWIEMGESRTLSWHHDMMTANLSLHLQLL